MFDQLSDRLSQSLNKLRGRGRLTDDNIADALRDVRRALLEADVALPVVKTLLDRIRVRALGREVVRSLNPGQVFVKAVHEELTAVLGGDSAEFPVRTAPPTVILMAGLQGAGKTTTAAKLAGWLARERNKKSLLVSADVYRPAAIDQLERVAAQVGAQSTRPDSDDPVAIATAALDEARRSLMDVLIVDTAGRLHVDAELMDEIKRIHAAIEPAETLFVADSMAGQDAVNVAKTFDETLPLTGVILTKADGDARGGAALSIREVTGKPIKFLGVGEKLDALERFHPERIASRILGKGDVLTLVEDAHRKVDKEQAEKLANKLKKGKGFDLADFRDQLQQMLAMGGMGAMLEKLPGANKLQAGVKDQMNDKTIKRQIAMIDSMTPNERRHPGIINGSRRRRIAQGSGTQVQDLNRLLKQFTQAQKMMKKMSRGGMGKLMRGMGGRLPPGMG
ncbi:MAG TPA: signal recognition particle protein [Gammaproteobacteria bacterium]|nr:signal recognition particle protein [Gammaproteobacteria bacterium]